MYLGDITVIGLIKVTNEWCRRRLKNIVKAATQALRQPAGTVDVHLVGNAKMIELNTRYRRKRKTTDILSFSAGEPFRSMGQLGELVISLPVARKQARERGLTLEMELQILMVHGVLHLMGLDHERSPSEARKMARFEEKILRATVPRVWIRRSEGRCLLGLIVYA